MKKIVIIVHIDIEDNSNIIFTKQDYDKYYGVDRVDFDLVMPLLLKDVFSKNNILFLGYGLKQDRLLEATQACVEGKNME